MRRIALAAALALYAGAAVAQTPFGFSGTQTGPHPSDYAAPLSAAALNAAGAGKVDTVGGVVTAPTVHLGLTVADGTSMMFPNLRGNKNTACGVGILAGYAAGDPNGYCKLSSVGLAPGGFAVYPVADSAALFVENRAAGPGLILQNPTFTATQIIPATSADRLAVVAAAASGAIRPTDWVFTNTAPEYVTAVQSIATDGSSITVYGWGSPGNGAAGQSPQGAAVDANNSHFGYVGSQPAALVNVISQPEGENTVLEMADVTGGGNSATGHEYDFFPNSFASMTATQDILLGGGVFLGGAGARCVGRWTGCFVAQGGEVNGGFVFNPDLSYTGRNAATGLTVVATPPVGPAFASYAPLNGAGANDFLSLRPGGLLATGVVNTAAAVPYRVDANGATFTASDIHLYPGSAATANVGSAGVLFHDLTSGGAGVNSQIAGLPDGSLSVSMPSGTAMRVSGAVQTGVLTVATLPPCNSANEAARLGVSDATAPTFLGVLTGGGTVHAPAYCNGTAWVAG